MAARRLLLLAVDGLSTVLAVGMRFAEAVAHPFLRLWWLARARARVDGVVPVTTQFDGAVNTSGRVRLELGEHCRLGRWLFLETCEAGVIRIGPNVRINSGVFIVSYAEVSIGRDCMIAEYAGIRDADHGFVSGLPIRQQPHTARPVTIGEGAWIGRGAVVLKGVTIGAGAIVGANSVVTRDVPPMTIVAGAPARVIGARPVAGAAIRPTERL